MKKWLVFVLAGVFLFALSCTTTFSRDDMLNVARELQTKINQLIEADEQNQSAVANRFAKSRSDAFSASPIFNPDLLIPREDFEAVYATQLDYTYQVYLEDYLILYKSMLDEIVVQLSDSGDNGTSLTFDYLWDEIKVIPAEVTMTQDRAIVLKSVFVEDDIETVVNAKIGMEDGNFYIRYLYGYSDFAYLYYFEYLESDYMMYLNLYEEAIYYQYVSQVDKTNFVYSHFDGTTEVSWFHPATMIRTTITRGLGGDSDYFVLFNEKGAIFSYLDEHASPNALIGWQLLEADGWDAAYIAEFLTPFNGVYREGSLLVLGARQYNIDFNPVTVSVRMDKYVPKSLVDNQIISLQAYGLFFRHPELTYESIQSKFANALSETTMYQIYRGIDFTKDSVGSDLLDVIDVELLPESAK